MYINIEYAKRRGLSKYEVIDLQLIRQQRYENLEESLEDVSSSVIEVFEEKGWITKIKGKSKDSEVSKLRTTSAGNKLLDNIETAEVGEDSLKIFSWLEEVYLAEDKLIGNKKRTKEGIAQFSAETGIKRNKLAILLKTFISDKENMMYNNKLENAFYSSKNLYSRKFSIDECRVFSYYEANRDYFERAFKEVV